ncbi:mycofactocin biosynthesis peptidyl-dipeptidase MftE [Amycolatopsis sp. H20-H5]|uniref:mycofactocin biosynthesis peptidyl-dipeptidase MftE n=1 Tax=Amycolatopsis sp. H20-H5 TaxID=3046309 RepID=UPI002DBBB400|nr:mycofactocin biosynthesis peptidyl-dipeptidase MftE [Amycolatopsis sp. H20-H5]MEC3977297.1 mycofactocin biosynthesis peptidyl-dipeptidase MftE [Amycolatopsis sp. H20-H5]
MTASHWTDVADQDTVLFVPVGSYEQHGPHLPLDTDTRVAAAVAASTGGLVVHPLAYGSSGEHEDFPGTISIGEHALGALLVEFGRSACRWARRLVFVNGHGGNVAALAGAVRLLRYEGRDVAWFACAPPGGDAHAGRTETSLLLAIAPETVDLARAEPGNTRPLAALLPALREGRLRELSPSGVLGDPAGATAEEGRALLGAMATGLRAALAAWEPDDGRLA